MKNPFLTGKALSAFLQILRANGVTEFPTEHGPIRLAPKAAKPAEIAATHTTDDPAAPAVDEDAEEIEDFRFALEKLEGPNFGFRRGANGKERA